MDKLNEYLQRLLSTCSDELRLEPDRSPYLVTDNSTTDLASVPLMGTQISQMIFPLIPANVRTTLPHRPEVEFVHPHNLGNFNFVVQKSSAGFVVTIRPIITAGRVPPVEPPAVPAVPPPVEQPEFNAFENSAYLEAGTPEVSAAQTPPMYDLESSSLAYDATSQQPLFTGSIPDIVYEEEKPVYDFVPNGGPELEVVSFNDPAYQTVFSDTATYEPPGRRDDFATDDFWPPADVQVPPVQPPPSVPVPEPVRFETPAQISRQPEDTSAMDLLFRKMADIKASDLHLSVSMPPMIRKDGKIRELESGAAKLTAESMVNLLTPIMPVKNREEFAERNDTDFAYEIPGLARFRCNVFMDRKGMGAVFRIIPSQILTAQQLGLSKAIMDLCTLSKGLVVVTGPTGSGKSTTLCAMVDHINKTREDHIITIEDPIEFTHENQKCLVNQREVHNHTDSFKNALRAALREDPDILLVGEMRDLETISIAIETAETGHLVFGTLHTTTAASTVDRIIDQFPADRQQQIRVMLSESLKGVIAQTLLPKKGGGRVAALEVLIITPAISNLIREGKTFQIPSAMQTGKNHGMVVLNDALFEHVKNGLVEPMDAYLKAVDKPGFEALLTRGGFKLK
jgi:twitching motility protein PilT